MSWVILCVLILFALLFVGRGRVENISGPSRTETLHRMFEEGKISKEELRERTRGFGQQIDKA